MTDNHQQPVIRRPSVALSSEDLTESEWFYLMCVSFSFPPGVGLVGEAYAKQQQLWLTGANRYIVFCLQYLARRHKLRSGCKKFKFLSIRTTIYVSSEDALGAIERN
ncbi:hypothetical protein L6452_07271 [Arctium lappa]|uniref:Uncharacterized protein n=1 Tax=Arctium lappa TaxID=4217 RepID=A0ACB9EL47_ARCLA|nr:hypothetical protein L6452_07271 [Arctium lappa]